MVDELKQQGRAAVNALAEMFDVTEMTIRRDLITLEQLGIAKRFHGGAELGAGRLAEPPFAFRSAMNADGKRRIAASVVDELTDEQAVYLDVGTTSLEVARCLSERESPAQITVITSSLRILDVLAERDGCTLISVGGQVRPHERSLVGSLATVVLERMWIDTAVLGVAGVDATAGLTESNVDDAAIKRLVIERSNRMILAADQSKLGQTSFAQVACLDSIDLLVTNGRGEHDELSPIEEAGVACVIA